MRHAVIMAGGSGTRLWPVSRQNQPKQFQVFTGKRSLLQLTYDRIVKNVKAENIWVVTANDYKKITLDQLPELKNDQVICEPLGRNTAAAIGLSTLRISKSDPEAIIAAVPSDHYIGKEDNFTRTVEAIYSFLEKDCHSTITIGINPTDPNTGLGYIKMGESLKTIKQQKFFSVASFHEKPDLATAKTFLEQWDYLWNGGYFFFCATTMLKDFQHLIPKTLILIKQFIKDGKTETYRKIPSEPIDTVIAEKIDHLAVAPADLDWSDLGNWATLHQILGRNGIFPQVVIGRHRGIDTENSLIISREKLVATVGVSDLVIINTEDVVLVADRKKVQDVKKLVDLLKEQGQVEFI